MQKYSETQQADFSAASGEPVPMCRSTIDPKPGVGWETWFLSMFIFGSVGVIVAIVAQYRVKTWAERDLVRLNHRWMLDQADQIRRGEIDCLVNPDPAFVDEFLSDAAYAVKVRDLYLGGDLSDPRLNRLVELPKLKCVVFLFARNHDDLLDALSRSATIEDLTFERTNLDRENLAAISRFAGLKSLAFSKQYMNESDMHVLHDHKTLERLSIERAQANDDVVALAQSLPRLREFYLGIMESDKAPRFKEFMQSLAEKLPQCKCRVWCDER